MPALRAAAFPNSPRGLQPDRRSRGPAPQLPFSPALGPGPAPAAHSGPARPGPAQRAPCVLASRPSPSRASPARRPPARWPCRRPPLARDAPDRRAGDALLLTPTTSL